MGFPLNGNVEYVRETFHLNVVMAYGSNPDVPINRCSVSKRVAAYAVPVVVLSVAVNVPKFLETRVVIERTHDPDTGQNVTNYSFDVTELRWVGRVFVK